MDGPADINGIGTHFNRQSDLTDQIASMSPDNPTTDDAVRILVKQKLRKPFISTVRNRATTGGPWKYALAHRQTFLLGFFFGNTHPCNFRIGVGHRWDHSRIKETLLAGSRLSSHMPLMNRLVGQHRLPNEIPNCKNMTNVGPHLPVNRDEALGIHRHARMVRTDPVAIGTSPHCDQHQVIDLFVGCSTRSVIRN